MIPMSLPFFCRGTVVTGFGRGSKELGIPTANFAQDVVDSVPGNCLEAGIYYGWAQVDGGEVNKMVMSVGWNPFYKNTKRAMEVHIMKKFSQNFYGSELKVTVLQYIRPERDFNSVQELIDTIRSDIATAECELDKPENQIFKNHEYFKDVLDQ